MNYEGGAAHELVHLVCHPKADPGGSQERQAHAFAAELLMPAHLIINVLPKRFDLGAYARLKHEWGVSIAALLYRARTFGVASARTLERQGGVLDETAQKGAVLRYWIQTTPPRG